MAEAGDEADRLASRPLVLVGGQGNGARVRAANNPALLAGIRPGAHTAARARARAADLIVRPWDDALILQAQEELAARLLRHSPAVTSAALGCFWLDAAGQERLGGDMALGAGLLRALQEAGHPDARVALAATVVAAQAAVDALEAGLLRAPGAGAQAFLSVPPDPAPRPGHGVDARFLSPLPLALLPLPGDLQEVLADLGLQTVGELASLPASSLELRFGGAGPRAIALARGLDPRGPICQGGPRTRAMEVLLEPPAESLEPLVFAARRALVSLLRALSEEGGRITRLRLRLRLDGDARPLSRDVGLARPSSRLVTLTDRCRSALSSITLPAPALSLTVEILERARGAGGEQGDLFEGRFMDPEALETALCRIRARCGPRSVVRPVPADSHCPEAQGRWQPDPPLGDEEPLPEPPPDSGTAEASGGPLRRALRTPEPPPRVEVRLDGQGWPEALRLGQRWQRIAAADPLYRRSGRWWRPEAFSRQDHLVTTEGGARLLLSRQDDVWRLLAWED